MNSLLLVELPVPAGRAEEWNEWYERVHIPEAQERIPGIVRTRRYRVLGETADDITHVVVHEFSAPEHLERFLASTTLDDRWGEYEELWGRPVAYRRRGLQPVFERTP